MVSFRPLFGVSLFLLYGFHHEAHSNMFSSPLRGISISTDINMCMGNWKHCFRPLYGVSLFLQRLCKSIDVLQSVFVPSTGYLYFYAMVNVIIGHEMFSSPLRGISISTSFHFYNYNVQIKFSSPLRGISISTLPRIPLENSKGIIWFAVQTHKPDNFTFISTCPELKMLYFTGIGAKS